LHHAVKQLPLIERFFEDGGIHPDDNAIDNKIRPLAMGRKNFLFVASHERAKKIIMMYSFFASCKEVDGNPYAWITDTLNRIGNQPINKLSELLPNNFKKLYNMYLDRRILRINLSFFNPQFYFSHPRNSGARVNEPKYI
jgi:hypothetical protein